RSAGVQELRDIAPTEAAIMITQAGDGAPIRVLEELVTVRRSVALGTRRRDDQLPRLRTRHAPPRLARSARPAIKEQPVDGLPRGRINGWNTRFPNEHSTHPFRRTTAGLRRIVPACLGRGEHGRGGHGRGCG
ncbi:hypothetical protein, partial [Frankia sp. Cr1]|uniref:hypothetical protein n=1 Tax=Frankia sp. Cr1 TaxID=3073931 RepID=UPI002AD2866A